MPHDGPDIDGQLRLQWDDQRRTYPVELKTVITNATLGAAGFGELAVRRHYLRPSKARDRGFTNCLLQTASPSGCAAIEYVVRDSLWQARRQGRGQDSGEAECLKKWRPIPRPGRHLRFSRNNPMQQEKINDIRRLWGVFDVKNVR